MATAPLRRWSSLVRLGRSSLQGTCQAGHLGVRCHSSSSPSVDDKEAAKFAALAAHWWDKQSGPFAALHAMNPTRLRFIQDTVADQIQRVTGAAAAGAGIAESGALPLQDVEVLDVGCGGGLLSETLARAGAKVTGIDITEQNIGAAQQHLQQDPQLATRVTYRQAAAEQLLQEGARFPVVLSSEVIEHVKKPADFLKVLAQLAQPDGSVIISTLNRTVQSYGLAIVGAEYVLGLAPRGTHHWDKFITPQELVLMGRDAGLQLDHLSGMWYNPLTRVWSFTEDCAVNYIAKFSRQAEQ